MSKRKRSAAESLPSGRATAEAIIQKSFASNLGAVRTNLSFSQSCVENKTGIGQKKGSIGFRSLEKEVSQLPSGGWRSRHDLLSPEGLKGRNSLVEVLLVIQALRS